MSSSDTFAQIERIVAQGGDADDVLRDVVQTLHTRYPWASISFVEDGELQLGPQAGVRPELTTTFPIAWQGEQIAELGVGDAPAEDGVVLEKIADLVAGHCLVGWDTGGESWDP
jgi:hypothetical protein